MTRPLLLLPLVALVGCCSRTPPPPGYDGPIASREARLLLGELRGRRFTDESGVSGGGEWFLEGFAVVPNPVTGKGPVARLVRPGADPPYRYGETLFILPMEADGDVIDLYRRVTGSPPSGFSGETSTSYRKALIRER